MGFQSFALLVIFFASLSASTPEKVTQTALPAITGPGGAPSQCGGCYIVADVAAVFFGEIITQTAIAQVSVGVTPNGTNITITTVVTPAVTPFTILPSPSGLEPAAVSIEYNGPTVTLNGATLVSPTAYDVFTAYSLTSTVLTDGSCSVVHGAVSTVSPAFSVKRPAGADAAYDQTAEESFISAILQGLPTCSGGGANVNTTTVTPQSTLTATFTTVAPIKPTLTAIPAVVGTTTTPSLTTKTTTITSTAKGTQTLTVKSTSSTTPVISAIVSALSIPTGSTTVISTISSKTIIIVSNTTFLQTGSGPAATIVPFKGQAANWRVDAATSWLLWAAGMSSIVSALWAL